MRIFIILLLCFSISTADYYSDIKQCNLDAIEQALKDGTNINTRDKQGYTALAYAAEKNDTELMGMLFEYQALPNIPNKNGYTPLNLATGWGNLEAIQILISQEASVNIAANDGTTPLMQAAQYGYVAVAKTLLAAGADPNLENEAGKTALALAQDWGYKEIALAIKESPRLSATPPKSRRRKTAQLINPETIVSVNLSGNLPPTSDIITTEPEIIPALDVTASIVTAEINLETAPVSRNLP